jgi:hypothetical protein
MNDFKIDFEWLSPVDIQGPELRATYGRLSIRVAEYPVTRVYDEQSKTLRDNVYVPLYPLAEWLAAHWWALWNEPGQSSNPVRPGYDARHSLVSAREGYAFPPLRIEQAGSSVRLSWSSEQLLFHRLEFPGRGEFWAETTMVKQQLASFIDAVVSRLDSQGIADTLLHQDWRAIQSADEDERTFCECSGALGLDPYSLDDRQQREIEDAGHRLPQEIVTEFFEAARREELVEEADEIDAAAARAQSNTGDLTSLKNLRLDALAWHEPTGAHPWLTGYSLAQKLRVHLGLDGNPLNSMESLADALGTTREDLAKVQSQFSTKQTPFVALMGMNDKSSPAFALRPGFSSSILFHFCRALFEYLSSPTRRTALITDARTEQQKRNRAFAAELLAPSSALRDRVSTPVVTWEQAEEIAAEFGVSAYIIYHQLVNHEIADVEQTW